jgi:glycine cleavage system H protein
MKGSHRGAKNFSVEEERMKSIEELKFPGDCRYSQEHEWAKREGGEVRVGITDYAQDQLGDVVYLELPQVGDVFKKDEVFGSVESVKAVSELFLPIGGEIVAVNAVLRDSQKLVNSSPYEKGWMIEVKPRDPKEMDTLLTKEGYIEMIKKMAE